MSARPYRHADGVGRKRYARTPESMTPADFLLWVSREIGDGDEPLISSGVHIEWYSPITAEEAAAEAEHKARAGARQEQYDRDTYERLRAKFEPVPDIDPAGGGRYGMGVCHERIPRELLPDDHVGTPLCTLLPEHGGLHKHDGRTGHWEWPGPAGPVPGADKDGQP